MHKISYYNFYIPVEEKSIYLLYNSFQNSLYEVPFNVGESLEVKSKESPTINSDFSDHVLFNNLLKEGFIIDQEKDEQQIVKHVKRCMYDNFKNNTEHVGLTLLITNNCNLGCKYCFEGLDKPKEYMKPEVFQNILNYISEKKIKTLQVSWYGGEPLMYPHLIENYGKQLMEICKTKNIEFHSSIITNGIYLTPENIKILESVNVKHIQVTLDGDKITHDKRRPFIHSDKSCYDTILNNLEQIKTKIPISIRINTDKEVYPSIKNLFEDLIDRKIWPQNQLISLYMGYTSGTDEYQDVNLYSNEEFAKSVTEFRELKLKLYNAWAAKNNRKLATYKFKYPSITHNYCGTLNGKNNIVIDAMGNISKCWEHVNAESTIVGNIKNGIQNEMDGIRYQKVTNLFDVPDKCLKCKIYPICDSTFCPNNNFENKIRKCSYWKYELENCLRDQYIMSVDHPESIENPDSAEERINLPFLTNII